MSAVDPFALEGAVVGRYTILHRLASGGMGSVYIASARGAGGFERLVAAKILHPHLQHDDEFIAMFLDEARLAARIHHPNVVATIDVLGEPDFMLVMEYVEGAHLGVLTRRRAERGQRVDVPIALRIILDALQGLAAAHELTDEKGKLLGLVHRDVSPQNVLVGADGIARLTDFGVARAESRLSTTREGTLKGKLSYMSPEHAAGIAFDLRSDIFAMGVVMWEVLAGRRLFAGDSDAEILARISSGPIPPLATLVPELAPLDAVMARALSRNPDSRFASARQMAEAIEDRAAEVGGIASARVVGDAVRSIAGDLIERAKEGVRHASISHPARRVSRDSLRSHSSDEVTRSVLSGVSTTGTGRREREVVPSIPPRPTNRLATAAIAGAIVLAAVVIAFAIDGRRWLGMASDPGEPPPMMAPSDHDARLIDGPPPVVLPGEAALAPTIAMRIRVGEDGTVREATVAESRPGMAPLEQRALEAVRAWRFEPAVRDGRPIETVIRYGVEFARGGVTQGQVRIKGSDTLGGQLLPDLAAAYRRSHPGVRVSIEAHGSSTGFVGIFDGSADIGASSRAIRADELEEAQMLNVGLHEMLIGWDGIAVVVHRDSPLQSITMDQLRQIYTGQITELSALGVSGSSQRLIVVRRPAESGTHAFFNERVLGGVQELDSMTIESNSEIVQFVASEPRAIGYVGMGAISPDVRVLPIAANNNPPIEPTRESIEHGRYPLARSLMLYVRDPPSAATLDFIAFVFSQEGRETIGRNGFVAVDRPPAALARIEPAPVDARRAEPLRLSFPQGSAEMDASRRARLNEWLASQPTTVQFVVSGHAIDEDDPRPLSERRAAAVAAALRERGVPASRIRVRSAGDGQPIAPRGTDLGQRLGRRVDVFAVE